jgi:hypothetical protein
MRSAPATQGSPGETAVVTSFPHLLSRRRLLLAVAGAALAGPAVARLAGGDAGAARARVREALVEALLDHGALPGAAADAPAAAERLRAFRAAALPARRRELDAALDALGRAGLPQLSPAARIRLLRRWAREGGERRAVAARALALAAAAYGPDDGHPLPVVI